MAVAHPPRPHRGRGFGRLLGVVALAVAVGCVSEEDAPQAVEAVTEVPAGGGGAGSADPGEVECVVTADCTHLSKGTCVEPLCAAGVCGMVQVPLGGACDDGDETTGWDACSLLGQCIGIPLLIEEGGQGGTGGTGGHR